MTSSSKPSLPPPNPEHRRVAAGQFERANQVVSTGNFDYGIRLLMSCCKLDPGNLIYRQALRRTEKAKYRNNLRGSSLAWLTTWTARARMKAAFRAREYVKVLEHGERILMRNPWDVGAQMDMSEAAHMLGLLDLAIWILEQARQKAGMDPHVNRRLADLYEKRGNFTQAIALWELVRKARPTDTEAQGKIRGLAADDTIARGQYGAVVKARAAEEEETKPDRPALTEPKPQEAPPEGAWWTQQVQPPAAPAPAASGGKDSRGDLPAARGTPTPSARPGGSRTGEIKPEQSNGPPSGGSGETPFLADRVAREAAPLRNRLQNDPTNTYLYLQLAAVYRRGDDLEQAQAILQQGLGPTGNSFDLTVELADVMIEPFRRDLALTEEKLKAQPEDAELRRLRSRLRKEITSRELDLYRQKADRYPTEMSHRYEVGVRLLRLGQVDEAIRELQQSRADPRHRWQSLLHLGHCFKTRNNWRLAQRNYEEALQNLPPGESNNRKEILFELATGCAESNDLSRAIDLATELANIDFSYRDIGRLLDEWQTRLQKANVS
jgi:tetratricopeptide (TPR) repeat protein